MSERSAHTLRETRETRIECSVTIDGAGHAQVELPLPFFRHMIESFVKYSGMDVELNGRGDVEVDHTTSSRTPGSSWDLRRRGSRRSRRHRSLRSRLCAARRGAGALRARLRQAPHVVYEMDALRGRINDFDVSVLHEFVRGYAQNAGVSLHLDVIRGDNLHHIAEAAFKSLGLATRQALAVIGGGIPSTKGSL